MNDLNDRGQRILQNVGVGLVAFGIAVITWEELHDSDWHVWLGVLLIVIGATFIWPPIVTPLASLGRTLAPFIPGTEARRSRIDRKSSSTTVVADPPEKS